MSNGSLLKVLEKERQWGLVHSLAGMEPLERITHLRLTFHRACQGADDERALIYFGWLMQAIAEADAAAWALPDRQKDWRAHDLAEKMGKARVAMAQADEALALYRSLPLTQKGEAREWDDQDSSHLVSIDVATLVKTRRAMLGEIAKGWRDAADDEEAGRYFQELHALEREARFKQYSEPVAEVIRETLGSEFSLERLVFTIRKFPASQHAEILAHAWAKKVGRWGNQRSVGELIAIVANHVQTSKGALEFLCGVAERLRDLDQKIGALKGMPHGATVEYRDLRTAFIRFDVIRRGYRVDENEFHRTFERVRDDLRTSKQAAGLEAQVFLEGRLREEYGEKKFLAQREEQL